jgi:hypothetical protein
MYVIPPPFGDYIVTLAYLTCQAKNALCVQNPLTKFRTVISDEDYGSLRLYGQYAAASYCDANRLTATGTTVSCAGATDVPGGNCPLVEQARPTIVAQLRNSKYVAL